MSQYEVLDAVICDRIAEDGPVFLSALIVGDTRGEAGRLAEATGRCWYRIIDGRLSALKAKDKIRYAKGRGWVRA